MNLSPELLAHKTLMIALVALAEEVAAELGVAPAKSTAATARELGASRTSAYEQKARLIRALTDLVAARPGRPAATIGPTTCRCEALELTVRVQAYRLGNLDAVIQYRTRTSYSPSFRRFILTELDGWQGARAAFADATAVPPDTLADWVRDDMSGISPPAPSTEPVALPVDASETTRAILEDFQGWEGSTKAFLAVTAKRYGLKANQVAKVLRICGAISPRPRRRFRHRDTTEHLSPGALLVTDGKTLDVELTGSGRRMRPNWQGMVDQATSCDTAVVVTDEEDAGAVRSAFLRSVDFLGGTAPDGLLHDNKPCYQDADLRDDLDAMGTLMVPATLGRPENKAILEGAFSLFEARVGTIRLDDSSKDRLITSAVSEVVRAYTAATNGVPRFELGGLSREAAVRSACPSAARQAADRAFIRQLKERHERERRSDWRSRIKPESRQLLRWVFARLGLEDRDPHGQLQEYLSTFEPAAIRQAAVIVSVRLRRGELDSAYAHRYLAKVIRAAQESLDLEVQAAELLELCRLQAQDWVSMEAVEYDTLQRDCRPEELALAVAERAAGGALPVAGALWTEKLLALLAQARHLVQRSAASSCGSTRRPRRTGCCSWTGLPLSNVGSYDVGPSSRDKLGSLHSAPSPRSRA